MALSRELRRRLLLEDEPLAKRLKLAENTFTSTDLRVTKKEDLVLKWLCGVAEGSVNEKNVVWSTMKRCLKFKNTSADIILKSEVKQSLIETLTVKLPHVNDSSQLNYVLECCELIFASCEMQQYFQSKPGLLGDLMKVLFKCQTCEDATRKCAANAVECFVTCYKQSANKEEFTDTFLREILYPMCGLIDKTRNDKLGAEIHKCIQQLLFGKSRYAQFKDYDGKDENNFASKLFAALKENCKIADEEISIVVFLYAFRAAAGSYKTDPSVIDLIFRNFVDSAGRVKVKLLNCLRENLTNVTFDYQNKIGDLTLFQYLENFIDEILQAEQLNETEYEALAGIAALNPLIIEAKLQPILKKILLEKKETRSAQVSYGNLMIGILEAEIRLRREQKLIPWMLTAVKQSLVDRSGKNNPETGEVFPSEFKDQFSKSVSNMTSTQTTDLLRSLIFHLNALCGETAENSKTTMTFLLQTTVDLIVAYFKGVRIYDHSMPLAGQEKFVLALHDLGKVITALTTKVLGEKSNKKLIVPLLTVAWYWDNVYNWIKYYVPDAAPKSLDFPISDDQMEHLQSSCSNNPGCKRAMNRILVQQMGRNLQGTTCLDTSKLLDGLEHSWSIILDENPQILSSMDNEQIAELARLFLEDAKSSKDFLQSKSMQRLRTDSIQNNERLVKTLVLQTLKNISTRMSTSTTKSVTSHVNVVKILNRGNLSKVLKKVKEEYGNSEWNVDKTSASEVEEDLRILLSLPLTHLDLDLRILILLVAYAMEKDCEYNDVISELTTKIMFDVLEKMDIDIIDYIEPSMLLEQLTDRPVIQRIVISCLRNVSSWDTMKELVKKSEANKVTIAMLLDCMEKVKSKLKSNQKEVFKKAEHKLGKKLLVDMEPEMTDHKEVKLLTKALKVPVTDNEISDHLVDVVKSTLDRIFVSEAATDEKLIAEGFQLVIVVLNRRSKFELSDELMMNVWPRAMKNPSKELVWPLLQASKAILSKVLTLLHKQTISGLNETNGTCFANALVVWDAVMNVDMGPTRNTLRNAAILNILEALLISNIPNESWPGVLQLVQSIFSKHAYATQQDIDVILLLAMRSLKEVEIAACEDVLSICYTLVKFKVGFITDRLPVLLILYGQLVRLVVRESRKDSSSERQLRSLALDIAKFTNTLIKLKKYLSRISPYVISSLVEMFSEGVIPSHVKGPLEDSVGHILSICDHHAISLLSRALPTATQGIFKTLYETYNKFYKFTGKI